MCVAEKHLCLGYLLYQHGGILNMVMEDKHACSDESENSIL